MTKEVQELLKGLHKMKEHCKSVTGHYNDREKCPYGDICDVYEDLPDGWDLPPLEEEE